MCGLFLGVVNDGGKVLQPPGPVETCSLNRPQPKKNDRSLRILAAVALMSVITQPDDVLAL
jgi:hypothetical protein